MNIFVFLPLSTLTISCLAQLEATETTSMESFENDFFNSSNDFETTTEEKHEDTESIEKEWKNDIDSHENVLMSILKYVMKWTATNAIKDRAVNENFEASCAMQLINYHISEIFPEKMFLSYEETQALIESIWKECKKEKIKGILIAGFYNLLGLFAMFYVILKYTKVKNIIKQTMDQTPKRIIFILGLSCGVIICSVLYFNIM